MVFKIPDRPVAYLFFAIISGILLTVTFSGLQNHLFDADDYEWMIEMTHAQDRFGYLLSSERIQAIRPVPDLVIYLAYRVWGENATAYHMMQIGWHFITGLLLLRMLRSFDVDLELSMLTSLLFLFNVAHFRTVHWIIAHYYIFAILFAICALINFACFLKNGQRIRLLWTTIALFISVTCHPTALSIAPFCSYLYWRRHGIGNAITQTWPLWIFGILGVIAIYLGSPWATQVHGAGGAPEWRLLIKNFLWFTSRLVTIAHWFLITPSDRTGLIDYAAGLLICIGTIALLTRNQRPVADWAVLAILAVLPFINHPPSSERWIPVGPSRQLYLATIGSSFVLAYFLREIAHRLGRQFWQKQGVLTLCVASLLASSYHSLQRSEALSYYTSGRSYIARKQLATGGDLLARALAQDATLVPFDAYIRMASASFGACKSQLHLLEKGLEIYANDPQLLLLAGISASLHDNIFIKKSGEKRIFKAFELTQNNTGQIFLDASLACLNLATYYQRAGQTQKAINIYRVILKLRPNYVLAMQNMANALLAQGQLAEAVHVYQKVLTLAPNDRAAKQHLLALKNLSGAN